MPALRGHPCWGLTLTPSALTGGVRSLVRGTPSGNAFLADLSANLRRGTLAPQRSRDECRIATKESPVDPDQTLSRLRPAPGRAAEVLAPPYDVLSSAEARERVKGKPWSFLHVSKAEIDLDPAIDLYHPAVYAKAAEICGA